MAQYDLVYRAESTFGGHGFGALLAYIDSSADPWTVKRDQGPLVVVSSTAYLGIGALFCGILAHYTFVAFGHGSDALDATAHAVRAVMDHQRAPDDDSRGR